MNKTDEPDLEKEILNKAAQNKLEQQIKDLETLKEVEDQAIEEDSDDEDMRRIIQ